MQCLFCQLANQKTDQLIYENNDIVAFHDIAPQAPIHVLIVPKRHISTLNDAVTEDSLLLGNMMLTAARLAKELRIADAGYRAVFNCNHDGGQAVFHIHLHLLGGRQLHWPPG